MPLGTNIRTLMDHYDCTYADVAQSCETSEQSIQQLVARDSKRSGFAIGIANYFRVPLEVLLTADRNELIENSSDPKNPYSRQPGITRQPPYASESHARQRPPGILISATLRQVEREGLFMSVVKSDGLGFVRLPSDDPNAYAVQVHGQQHSPRVRHGEYLVVEPNVEAKPGDEVLVGMRGDDDIRLGVFLFTANGLSHFDGLTNVNGGFQAYAADIEYTHVIAAIAKSNLVAGGGSD